MPFSSRTFLILFFFFLALGSTAALSEFLPNFLYTQVLLFGFCFLFSALCGIFYLRNFKGSGFGLRVLVLLLLFSLSSGFIILPKLFDLFPPELVKVQVLGGRSFYLYRQSCPPPDNLCECENRAAVFYVQNPYLPLLHPVGRSDFYADSLFLRKSKIIAGASGDCPQDQGKEMVLEVF